MYARDVINFKVYHVIRVFFTDNQPLLDFAPLVLLTSYRVNNCKWVA